MRRSFLVGLFVAVSAFSGPAGAQGLTPSEAADVAAHARARNLFNCNNGLYGCDRSQLTSSEQEEVSASARARNLFNCNNGLYGCDKSRLTSSQQEEVAASARARNLFNCNNGLYGCDRSQLTSSEQEEVSASARARNLFNCNNGLYGCDKSRLTSSQQEEVAASARTRNLFNCNNGLYGCDRRVRVTPAQNKAASQPKRTRSTCLGVPGCAPKLTATDKVLTPELESSTEPSGQPGACAENGSCYGDLSAATGQAKTVHVNGYFRKDGTYVRGYYRSPPRSGGGRRR